MTTAEIQRDGVEQLQVRFALSNGELAVSKLEPEVQELFQDVFNNNE